MCLARGKKHHDSRPDIAKRDADLDALDDEMTDGIGANAAGAACCGLLHHDGD